MKKLLYILPVLALLAIVVIRLRSNKKTTAEKVYTYNKEQVISVQADTLRLMPVQGTSFFSGIFEPDRETRISSESPGKIQALFADAGSVVNRGQALVKLDDALLKIQLQSVEVQIEGLETDVNRYRVLTQADAIQGVQLEKAELALKAARIQRSNLLEQIAKTTIHAPFSGIITQKMAELGAYAAPGVPLLQLTDIRQLRFTVQVPEQELSRFSNNRIFPIHADAYPNMTLKGKISMIGSKGNQGNSFPVQFLVTNLAGQPIKAGMFGTVSLEESSTNKALVIPASAIAGSGLQPQVWLIKNGRAVLTDITVSRRLENRAVVSSGLKEGDLLVTGGFINLFEGANVRTP